MKLLKNFLNINLIKILLSFFSLIVSSIILSCTNFNDIDKNRGGDDFIPPPEMEFFGFRRESYNTNFKQMELFATNAKFYENRKVIELLDTRTYTYEEDGTIAASVEGKFATINQVNLFVEMFTNVVAKASNNTILYSEHIQWNNEEKLFKSPVPVRMEQEDGSWLTGTSMEGDMSMENVTIYNEVDEGSAIGVSLGEENNAEN